MKFIKILLIFLLAGMLTVGCGKDRAGIVEPPNDDGDTPGNPPNPD